MKNAWLGSAVGVVLGGAAVWCYLGYSGQSTAIATVQQPKTTQQSPESKKSSFLSQELVDARLNELSFKEVMRLFYKDNMRNVFVNEGEIETQNFVAIGSADEAGENTVALMHPIINYRKVEGEARFLVMIEKVQVSENGSVVSCHACVGSLDGTVANRLT